MAMTDIGYYWGNTPYSVWGNTPYGVFGNMKSAGVTYPRSLSNNTRSL